MLYTRVHTYEGQGARMHALAVSARTAKRITANVIAQERVRLFSKSRSRTRTALIHAQTAPERPRSAPRAPASSLAPERGPNEQLTLSHSHRLITEQRHKKVKGSCLIKSIFYQRKYRRVTLAVQLQAGPPESRGASPRRAPPSAPPGTQGSSALVRALWADGENRILARLSIT